MSAWVGEALSLVHIRAIASLFQDLKASIVFFLGWQQRIPFISIVTSLNLCLS